MTTINNYSLVVCWQTGEENSFVWKVIFILTNKMKINIPPNVDWRNVNLWTFHGVKEDSNCANKNSWNSSNRLIFPPSIETYWFNNKSAWKSSLSSILKSKQFRIIISWLPFGPTLDYCLICALQRLSGSGTAIEKLNKSKWINPPTSLFHDLFSWFSSCLFAIYHYRHSNLSLRKKTLILGTCIENCSFEHG